MDPLGKKDSTQVNLQQAVFRAARLLEQHLDTPPSAKKLAREVGVSMHHFHRVFRAVVGETISQHSVRLRVEYAASLLKFSSWHIQEISLICGFSTQSGLSRTFRKFYGMSPREFRDQETIVPFLRTPVRSWAPTNEELPQAPIPTVRIESWPDFFGIAFRFYGPMARVHEPWAQLLEWAKGTNLKLDCCRFFGLWFDDYGVTGESKFRYECVLVPPEPLQSPAPFLERIIPAGQVAIVTAHGNLKTLDRTWRAFGYGWFPFSGFQPRLNFVCDEYPARLMLSPLIVKAAAGLFGFKMNLCLPVQSKPMDMLS